MGARVVGVQQLIGLLLVGKYSIDNLKAGKIEGAGFFLLLRHMSQDCLPGCYLAAVSAMAFSPAAALCFRASLTAATTPPMLRYQTKATGRRITGITTASATIVNASILFPPFYGHRPFLFSIISLACCRRDRLPP